MRSQGTTYRINVDTNGNKVLPQLTQNAKKADTSLHRVGQDQSGLKKTKTNADRAGQSLHNAGRKGSAGLGMIERRAHRTGSSLSKLRGIAAGLGLMLSTGALATGLVGTGAGFEKSMSNVKALANATETEMVSLEKAARDAGSTTAYSAKQSADAMGYLAQAGYDANQQVAALPATLNLAAAGGMDLARSADIATNILSQYRMQASDTDVVVDQLAFTQSNFNTNVEEMADAMNYLGPSAQAMKISLSESNAVVGLLANNGLKGSMATRALASSIVRLNDPTSKMQGTIDQLNLQLHNSQGEFIGVAGMVDQLNNRFEGLNDKQRQAALSSLFGAEAIQEMNILLAEGAGKIRYWTDELDNASGAAKRMAETKMDNLAGDFKKLQSVSQETSLQIYEHLGPALRDITKEATLFVKSLDTEQVGLALKKTVYTIRRGLIWLKKHKDTIINLGKAMVVLKVATLSYNKGVTLQASLMRQGEKAASLFAGATKKATFSFSAFKKVVRTSGLGLLLTALSSVVTMITLFGDRTKQANAQLDRLKRKKDLAKTEGLTLKDESKTAANLLGDNEATLKPRQLANIRRDAKTRIETYEDLLAKYKATPQYKKLSQTAEFGVLTDLQSEGKSTENLDPKLRARVEPLQKELASLGNLVMGMPESEMRRLMDRDKSSLREANNRLGAMPEDQEPTTDPGSPVIDEGKSSENIIGGGASQRIVNVKLEKFQDDVVFNVYGQLDELRDSVDEMREMVNEQFMRIMNSANQLANG